MLALSPYETLAAAEGGTSPVVMEEADNLAPGEAEKLPATVQENLPKTQDAEDSALLENVPTSGTCGNHLTGNHLTWTLKDDGTLSIFGTGKMEDYYSSGSAPWSALQDRVTSVEIGAGITGIGSYAFDNCNSLTSIAIPSGVTSIGHHAFSGCSSLTSIVIPMGVTSIEWGTFSRCSSLTSITIPQSVTSIGDDAFRDCSSLINVTIPDGITSIGDSAFNSCISLTNISIPDSVTFLGDYVFTLCGSLSNITIPDKVANIGRSAFYECANLSEIKIGANVTNIGAYAFYDCTDIGTITLPNNVSSIGEKAFNGCTSLSSINIPNKTEYIGDKAFYNCTGLTSIDISNNGIRVGDRAFYRCKCLTNITLIRAGNQSFYGCTNLTKVSFSEGAEYIADEAFAYCDSLKEVHLPGSITNIGEGAFRWCYSLESINLPYMVSIGSGAFAGCTRLSNSQIASSVNEPIPAKSENKNDNLYQYCHDNKDSSWTDTAKSFLYQDKGLYYRIEFIDGKIVVETYTSTYRLISSRSVESDLCAYWGGFFAGESYNFVILGWENPLCADSTEVMRIIKYDKQWNKLGQTSLYGGETYTGIPFGGADDMTPGTVACAEYNGILYIYTCHLMYNNHQANLTLSVREDDMIITDRGYMDVKDLYTNFGYVSHSLNQFLLVDQEQNIVTLDLGDAYPNSIYLQRYKSKAGEGKFTGHCAGVHIQRFNNSIAAIGGLAETASSYVTAYNYRVGTDPKNVYLSFTSKDDFSENGTKTVQVTSYSSSDSYVAGTPLIVPTGGNEGYVLWAVLDSESSQSQDTISYVKYFEDGSLSEIKTVTGALSDCQPIVCQGNVVWYVTDQSIPLFYVLNESGLKTIQASAPTAIRNAATNEASIEACIHCSENTFCTAYCAFYSEDGQMLSVQIEELICGKENTVIFTIENSASYAKIFVLDGNYVAQCAEKEVRLR